MASVTPEVNSRSCSVSVVIPAYNYAHYLSKAIDSALLQEHANYEIIIVDDGSTDNTAEVIKQYGDRVRYIYQKNAGLPAARNTGIRAARFDYIGLLDADDEWLPGFLCHAMETFDRLPPEFAIVTCRAAYIDGNSTRLFTKRLDVGLPGEITCRDIILKSRFSPSAVVARKAAFEETGFFDETLCSSEDRDMWIRIAGRHRVWLSGKPLALIRRHPANMSKHADRMKASIRRVIRKAYQSQLVSRRHWFFWLRVLSFYHFQAAWMYWNAGRSGQARRELAHSFLLWPCFSNPRTLNEPRLFRLRALRRFLQKPVTLQLQSTNPSSASLGPSAIEQSAVSPGQRSI